MPSNPSPVPPFEPPYAPDDRIIAARLIEDARLLPDQAMLREFALSTKEGLALMVLAEALLRVPDAATADQFIEDRLGQGDFVHHETKSSDFLVNASARALGLPARVIQPGETPQGTIGRLAKRLGLPAVRAATRQAMRLMGNHFVLGETIESALERAHSTRGPRYSFDMLGEGAHGRGRAALFQVVRHRDRCHRPLDR
jgi:RHH-type transcriptional regulator, proline utilization regulon repressor / proline dehydrogenase / delta 1-pyrroline-5-carboxylate dehydrogenase